MLAIKPEKNTIGSICHTKAVISYKFNDIKIDAIKILFQILNNQTSESVTMVTASGKFEIMTLFPVLSKLTALLRTREKVKYLFITIMQIRYNPLTFNMYKI